MKSCFVIAEAGVNHNGSLDIAFQLIDEAVKSGADAVKFQSFKADLLVTKNAKTAEYQRASTGIADQFSMLKKLEMSVEFHQQLFNHCKKQNIEFMSTPFDIDSAHYLIDSGMGRLKIPSGELTNIPFLKALCTFDKPIILSTGMATLEEVAEAVETIRNERLSLNLTGSLGRFLTILHCTSNYPAKYEDVNLKAMKTMASQFELPVGYSDHSDGIMVPVAAVAMGATVIEKHFTLSCEMEGPDHKASLEPGQLTEMVKQIRQVESCLGSGEKKPTLRNSP
ncbi:N-acetylneuraminate synthase family protein [Endozoicomonas ascidiicola]|uniref:N-acetylneuraminate synthase family protein n=1 Tax=Endozoicomonas ascidiicola TaxID=1698521 RepID=UPI0008307BD1|nr:N-acetylneuraminate synthase family protein [Endozoicomonas ascidiicola]